MPQAIPMIVGAVVSEAIGGAVLFSIGSFAVTTGAVFGGIASIATSDVLGSKTK